MRIEANQILQAIAALIAEFPDLEDDETLRADMLEAETNLNEFLRKLERSRQETAANSEALGINIKELKARLYRFERREEAMRLLALRLLSAADRQKVELPEATLSIRNVPPSVIITDENALPDCACKFERKPDKTAIRSMLEVGPVEGACMSNGSKTLAIRIR